jgi:hypothetical protein
VSRRCLDQADDLIWNKHPRQPARIAPILFIEAARYYPIRQCHCLLQAIPATDAAVVRKATTYTG